MLKHKGWVCVAGNNLCEENTQNDNCANPPLQHADADVALRLCQHRSDGYLYVPATVPLNPQYPL